MLYSVNNIRLFVREQGQGAPALVFLHFYGGSSQTWQAVTDQLQARYRCLAYDHRGWGLSDKPATGYGIPELAADATALLAQLGLTSYVLVGHSMGGKVAQLLASQQPAGLKGLILVAPSPATPTHLPEPAFQGLLHAYDTAANASGALTHVLTHQPLPAEVHERTVADMQRHVETSRVGWPMQAMQQDVSANLARINVPVLVIASEFDQVDPVERLQTELLPLLPGAQLLLVPNAGHLVMLEAPTEVAHLIDTFVQTLDLH
jgi:3-oxoadipate enol-lactonase